jgi:hypothetical protein
MKQAHWQHSNHFVHYGGAGLNMLAPHTIGFLQEFDGGFRFDDLARSRSGKELVEQLAVRIFDQPVTVAFSAIFAQTCNGSPATASMYKDALATLVPNSRRLILQRYVPSACVPPHTAIATA